MEAETQNIFILGLAVLFGWMLVVLICASPQLFRDCVSRRCNKGIKQNKIKMAEARLQATLALAEKPSAFLLGQVVALSHYDTERNLEEAPGIDLEMGEDEVMIAGPSSA